MSVRAFGEPNSKVGLSCNATGRAQAHHTGNIRAFCSRDAVYNFKRKLGSFRCFETASYAQRVTHPSLRAEQVMTAGNDRRGRSNGTALKKSS